MGFEAAAFTSRAATDHGVHRGWRGGDETDRLREQNPAGWSSRPGHAGSAFESPLHGGGGAVCTDLAPQMPWRQAGLSLWTSGVEDGAWRLLEVPPSPSLEDAGDGAGHGQSRVVASSIHRSWGHPPPRVCRDLRGWDPAGTVARWLACVTQHHIPRSVPAVAGVRVSWFMAVTFRCADGPPLPPSVDGRSAGLHLLAVVSPTSSRTRSVQLPPSLLPCCPPGTPVGWSCPYFCLHAPALPPHGAWEHPPWPLLLPVLGRRDPDAFRTSKGQSAPGLCPRTRPWSIGPTPGMALQTRAPPGTSNWLLGLPHAGWTRVSPQAGASRSSSPQHKHSGSLPLPTALELPDSFLLTSVPPASKSCRLSW